MHDDMKNTTPDSHKKKRIVIGVSALLVAILAAGGAVAIYQHSVSAQLVEAKEACAQASETLRVARNKYDTLHDRDAAEAVKITGKQVEDGDTVTVLAAAYKETVPDLAACNVDGVDGLREVTAQIDKDAAWYSTHTASLSKAVAAVNKSHDAKTLKDAKEALSKQLKDLMGKVDASVKAKTDADRKAAGEQAQREAEAAAAAAQAQVQANSQAQQSYTAPQQSYTPTYTAPAAPQYTAPQQTAPVQPAQPAQPSKPNTGSGPVSGGHGCNEGNCSSTPDLGYIPR